MGKKIISKRGKKAEPQPSPAKMDLEWPFIQTGGRIIIKPDGSWVFPDSDKQNGISPEDEEVLRRTAGQQPETD